LLTLPLFHVNASHNIFLLSVMIGRKVVMMHKWDVQVAMSLIERERVTTFSGVPTMSAELQHAAADEVAVFGLPDRRLGEIVGAAVVLHAGEQLDKGGLSAFLAERLAKFKIPEQLWFHEDKLPRVATGKVFKRQLKDDYSTLLAEQS
jgi:acyl-CoA synthetase (AMP-forming)/AMP-acid ligase II